MASSRMAFWGMGEPVKKAVEVAEMMLAFFLTY
jgi:hypothetical protein